LFGIPGDLRVGIPGRLRLSIPGGLRLRALTQQRLEVAGMIFAHRRKPALYTLVIRCVRGPGRPGTGIFLPNGLGR